MQPSPKTHVRWILILLVTVVAGTLLLFDNPYSYSLYPSSPFLRVYTFLVPPLATLEWYYAYARRVEKRRLFLLFCIGIATTVGSAVHSTLIVAGGLCDPGVSGRGFPLPWYLTIVTYTGRGPLPPCPLFVDRPWGAFAIFSFLFDTIFYVAFAIIGSEFYSWTRRKKTVAEDRTPYLPSGV